MPKSSRTCSVTDPPCGKPEVARGWCAMHYTRWRMHGDHTFRKTVGNGEAFAYFQANLHILTDECKIWPYGKSFGYGMINVNGTMRHVHHLACIEQNGPRPPGKVASHGPCHNRACWNGRHLSWQTRQADVLDRKRDGTDSVGSRNGAAKLTENLVTLARAERLSGVTVRVLAIKYGVSRPTMSRALAGRTWQHVQLPGVL